MRLEKASYKAIKYACQHYHYSGTVPSIGCSYSVFNDNGEWCGVIMFSSGANNRIGKPYGLVQGQVCELVRMALNGKQESTSKALAIALRLIKKHNPLLEIVISYADCDQEHIGTIYQATNFIYNGLKELNGGTPKYRIFGKVKHPRSLNSKGYICNIQWIRDNIDPTATLVYTAGKHKYVYPLNKEMRAKAQEYQEPHPKKLAKVA